MQRMPPAESLHGSCCHGRSRDALKKNTGSGERSLNLRSQRLWKALQDRKVLVFQGMAEKWRVTFEAIRWVYTDVLGHFRIQIFQPVLPALVLDMLQECGRERTKVFDGLN